MIGAIIGDIAGSTYEFSSNKSTSVPLFPPGSSYTDDTILTVATAEAVLSGKKYGSCYVDYGLNFPDPMGGYGARFREWIEELPPRPYGSWGNGSAMRVGPIGWAFDSLDRVLVEAEASAAVSHNHPEGIKGAQATAATIFLARTGSSKEEIRKFVTGRFEYDLARTADEVRRNYAFNESCQRTVPEALIAFLDSNDFEDALRLAISLGGDADTVGCITGSVAHAFYRKIPAAFVEKAHASLPDSLREVVCRFESKFACTPD